MTRSTPQPIRYERVCALASLCTSTSSYRSQWGPPQPAACPSVTLRRGASDGRSMPKRTVFAIVIAGLLAASTAAPAAAQSHVAEDQSIGSANALAGAGSTAMAPLPSTLVRAAWSAGMQVMEITKSRTDVCWPPSSKGGTTSEAHVVTDPARFDAPTPKLVVANGPPLPETAFLQQSASDHLLFVATHAPVYDPARQCSDAGLQATGNRPLLLPYGVALREPGMAGVIINR